MPSLSSHPIFHIERDTYRHMKQSIRRNIVAFKGTEVYVAVGSTVRYAELREWYALASPPEDDDRYYRVLRFPTVTFEIQELVWNQSCTQLALVGDRELAILVFPRLGLTSILNADTIQPKILHIGKSVYSAMNTISKALFHPYSKHDNTLVVLSSDSHLRIFELSLSPHVPENDIRLFSSPQRGYTVDYDIPVPISFTFGASKDWLIWTIFVLTRDGDIYILCPIMPTKCIMTRSAIARMKTLISHRANEARTHHSSLAEQETCLNQTRWLKDILGQISTGEYMGLASSPALTGADTGDMVPFRRPNKVRPSPAVQGPVLFQPAPTPMNEILSEASDIAFLDADGTGLIVTTWRGGRVDVGVLIDGIEGVWSVKGVSREDFSCIRVAAYESIDMPVSEGAWTGIVTSVNDYEGVFIAAGSGVWQIDFRRWLQELEKLNQDDEDGDREPFQLKPSVTDLIVNESPDFVVGYGLLFDPFLDYHLLTISSTAHSRCTELSIPALVSLSTNGHSRIPPNPRRTTKPATYLAYPFPDDLLLKSPSRSVLSGLRIHPNILREKDPISMDAVRVLGDVTVHIRNIVNSILHVGEGLRRRLELQHRELEAQLFRLSSVCRTVSNLQGNAASQDKRLVAITERQAVLESQANALLRKLLTINQPQTSEAEEKWFKELSRVKAKLEGPRGLLVEAKSRMSEGRKYLELARENKENGEEPGKQRLDSRVMESIEEGYGLNVGLADSSTRKVERLKMRTAKLNSAL